MFKPKRKIPLYVKIIAGLILGTGWGLLASYNGWAEFTVLWIKPWGTIFINLLKLIAVPLIFVSLITGITSLTDIGKLTRIGLKTISLYILTTVIAISTGLFLVNIIEPGKAFPENKKIELQQKYADNLNQKTVNAKNETEKGPLQFLVDIIPDNIFQASSDNSKMLQVIFFAIFLGICLVLIPAEKAKPVIDFFDGMNHAVLKMIEIIMFSAPVGVFSLIASIITDFSGNNPSESISLFMALGMYSITILIGLFFLLLILYPLILKIICNFPPLKFLKGIFPAQLLAFSTSSSAATLPVTMEQCEKELNVPKQISSFCLPLGATINMDGTSLYQAVAAVFIGQSFGIDLTFSDQLIIILTATLSSIGSAAVPGAGVIMLVIVLNSVHVPAEGIALILAVDRILDMFRTVVNITGDAMVATLISFSERNKIRN